MSSRKTSHNGAIRPDARRVTSSGGGRRRIKRRLPITAMALAALGMLGLDALDPVSALQEAPTDSYIVVMAADPIVGYDGDEPGLEATAPEDGEKLDASDPAVVEYAEHLLEEQEEVAADAGVSGADIGTAFTTAISGFEAELTDAEVTALERDPAVSFVVANEMRQLQTDSTGDFLGLNDPNGVYESGYTGEGVVVGIIDSGIWPEHPSFADDGTFPELEGFDELPCMFGDTDYNPDDAPFDCNNKLLGAYDFRDGYKAAVGSAETFNSAR
ncbi:MAG: protease inhibitor I9 family protein, partial [Actinomycetota bacterium]